MEEKYRQRGTEREREIGREIQTERREELYREKERTERGREKGRVIQTKRWEENERKEKEK